jgi:hypothetical protein
LRNLQTGKEELRYNKRAGFKVEPGEKITYPRSMYVP